MTMVRVFVLSMPNFLKAPTLFLHHIKDLFPPPLTLSTDMQMSVRPQQCLVYELLQMIQFDLIGRSMSNSIRTFWIGVTEILFNQASKSNLNRFTKAITAYKIHFLQFCWTHFPVVESNIFFRVSLGTVAFILHSQVSCFELFMTKFSLLKACF